MNWQFDLLNTNKCQFNKHDQFCMSTGQILFCMPTGQILFCMPTVLQTK